MVSVSFGYCLFLLFFFTLFCCFGFDFYMFLLLLLFSFFLSIYERLKDRKNMKIGREGGRWEKLRGVKGGENM